MLTDIKFKVLFGEQNAVDIFPLTLYIYCTVVIYMLHNAHAENVLKENELTQRGELRPCPQIAPFTVEWCNICYGRNLLYLSMSPAWLLSPKSLVKEELRWCPSIPSSHKLMRLWESWWPPHTKFISYSLGRISNECSLAGPFPVHQYSTMFAHFQKTPEFDFV